VTESGDEGGSDTIADIRQAAEQGDPEKQFSLGLLYDNGELRLLDIDLEKAVYWYQQAAEQGHAEAARYLAISYGNGEGVERSNAEAVRWYAKSEALGDSESRETLNNYKFNGGNLEAIMVDMARKEAKEWFQQLSS
jgi:TPR repeat protein